MILPRRVFALLLMAQLGLGGRCLYAAGFEMWDTDHPVRVARGPMSIFDVHASMIDPDRFFVTYWQFTPVYGHTLAEYRLQRGYKGLIMGLADPESASENFLWGYTWPQIAANPWYLKSIEILSEDTHTVRMFLSGEQGRGDNDGSIELISIDRGASNAVTDVLWKDLTGEHPDGQHDFQPCGVAVAPVGHRLIAPTDIMNGTNGFRVYGYDADTLAETGSVYAVGDLVTNGTGATYWDGPRAIALADGTFLIGGVGAPLLNQGIWKIDPVAQTATQILFKADIEDHDLPGALADPKNPVQDMLVANGYLYLAQYSGRILAFAWDADRQTVKDRQIDGLLNLTALYASAFGQAGANAGGLSLTTRGELLVSSMQDGSVPMVVAFNVVPKQKSVYIFIR